MSVSEVNINSNSISFPQEIKFQIFQLLPIKDILNCQLVCRDFKVTLSANHLWKHLFQNSFPKKYVSIVKMLNSEKTSINWQSQYRSHHILTHHPKIALSKTISDNPRVESFSLVKTVNSKAGFLLEALKKSASFLCNIVNASFSIEETKLQESNDIAIGETDFNEKRNSLITDFSLEGNFRLLNFKTGEILKIIEEDHASTMEMREDKVLAAVKDCIKIWDLHLNEAPIEITLNDHSPTLLLYINDGQLISIHQYARMCIWNLQTQHKLNELDLFCECKHEEQNSSLIAPKKPYFKEFELSNEKIFGFEWNGFIRIWNAKNHQLLKTFKTERIAEKYKITDQKLFLAMEKGWIEIWDYHTGVLLKKWKTSHERTLFLETLQDDKLIICFKRSLFENNEIHIWDISSETLLFSETVSEYIQKLEVRNEKIILSTEKFIQVWDFN